MKTADELNAEGRMLSAIGNLVVFLYPSQEWMAVKMQTPFLRYGSMNEQLTMGEPDDQIHD